MNKVIIKYALLIIISIVVRNSLVTIVIAIWPDILTVEKTKSTVQYFGSAHLKLFFGFFINIIFIALLINDMKKEQLKSIPLLILTFFSSIIGVSLFLLLVANKRLCKQ
jgi:hypothetical protein